VVHRQHNEGDGSVADVAPEMTVGDGFPLSTWLTTYRDCGRAGDPSPDERAALESVPGWTW